VAMLQYKHKGEPLITMIKHLELVVFIQNGSFYAI